MGRDWHYLCFSSLYIVLIISFVVFFFFFFGQAVQYMGSCDQGSNLSPLGLPWLVWW